MPKIKTEVGDFPIEFEEDYLDTELVDDELNDKAEDSSTFPEGFTNQTVQPKAKQSATKSTRPKKRWVKKEGYMERWFTRILLKNLGVNDEDKKKVSCDECGYMTPKRVRMLLHMKRFHTGIPNAPHKLFCCEICGARLAEPGALRIHKRIHTGEKPYACPFDSCNRRFLDSAERGLHVRRHLGEKPYKCDQCSNEFISRTGMNNHIRNRHSNLRPFHCDECTQTFKTRDALKKHKLTHTSIRPYTCEVCGRAFRQRGAHAVHVNIHTDNRPYKCSVCGNGFHSTAARRAHEKVVHKKA